MERDDTKDGLFFARTLTGTSVERIGVERHMKRARPRDTPYAKRRADLWLSLVGAVGTGACDGRQSALAPAGTQAAALADLFWAMLFGAGVVWLVVVGLAMYAVYFSRRPLTQTGSRVLIIGGGVVVPTVVLTGLLVYSLSMLPDLLAPAPEGALKVRVTSYQWWWRVRYPLGGDEFVELANEIHLPVNRPVEFLLDTPDVIHSFWIPSLGGKVDMIPGRRTRLLLEPTQMGTYRGVCAEYCGTSHSNMSFVVVVETAEDFERWLSGQQQPASQPHSDDARQGAEVFMASGCGACHSVRGSGARGRIGPDLTHVGSRLSIGAGTLTAASDAFRRFVSRPEEVKPGVHMPAFGMLPARDLEHLTFYLKALQ